MQQPKDWLGQEIEPSPVDRVEEARDAAFVLVVADGFPFLGTSKKLGADLSGFTGRDGHRR